MAVRTLSSTRLCLVSVFLLHALASPLWGDRVEATTGVAAQAQTLEDIESIGTAALAWLIDQVFPSPGISNSARTLPAAEAKLGAPTFDVHDVPVITAMDLEALLVPAYLDALPTTDGWSGPYEFRLDTITFDRPAVVIRSAGADGTYAGTIYSPGFTTIADDDIVWFDGMFVKRPQPSAAEAADYTSEVLAQISAAVASWRTDQVGSMPEAKVAGLTGCDGHQVDVSTVPPITADGLEALLAPGYLTFLPRIDGWKQALDFRFDGDLFLTSEWLAVRSPGSDGVFEGSVYTAGFTAGDAEDLLSFDFFAIRRPPVTDEQQAETRLDMQVVGTALLSWVTDNFFALEKGGPMPFDVGDLEPISHQDLEALLVPFYLPCLAKTDFWGNDYDFWLDDMNLFAVPLAGIRSRGSDGVAEGPIYCPGAFPADFTDNDLLWVDGVFLRFPDPELLFIDGFETGDVTAWSASEP